MGRYCSYPGISNLNQREVFTIWNGHPVAKEDFADHLVFFFGRTQPEPEVIYLKHVEQQKQQTKKEEVVEKFGAPSFLTPLRDQAINEGERIHFEAKISPIGDPTMKVEWYFNGAAIPASK